MAETKLCINYVPGEECRVAIIEDGKLQEVHAEQHGRANRVGNIYVGKVTNVEQAIQAAFVDFGVEENGFLHVSDLHPQYFPGEDDDTTERVGKKTPRRERPPIQQALKRGQEIIVQVLKDGVGTKGPALTAYLSIPGRYLVMMPQMDKVGVSRKVEDEDQRREMRKILDQLELPEGFGFILRTAGMSRTKTELKRDLAYLGRLWKDMEARRKKGKRPRLLYTESDLLVRALRDLLTSDIDEVVIDHPIALERANRFMKIVAPRSSTKLKAYTGKLPLFHAFGIEEQIAAMHAREVPLPSGGRLVIDETEALVAIDVNSGKSRGAKDAETNAYKTNMEAADEISRQLRLRDLGGLVINDLIDMRHAKHRKALEQQFKDRLKLDRAKSTTLPISAFGIMEMTRQRMRGSHERVHFTVCPECEGRGLVQKPESVAADALRELSALLSHDKVSKVELVVNPKVAGELLSSRRQTLNRIEQGSGKRADVRVSETLPPGTVRFYAYDDQGSDIEIDRLPKIKLKKDDVAPYASATDGPHPDSWALTPEEEREMVAAEHEVPDHEEAHDAVDPIALLEPGDDAGFGGEDEDGEGGGKKKRRRRRRRRRGRGGDGESELGEADSDESEASDRVPDDAETDADESSEDEDGEAPKKKRRRRRRRRRRASDAAPEDTGDEAEDREDPEAESDDEPEAEGEATDEDDAPKKKRRRRRRRRRAGSDEDTGEGEDTEAEPAEVAVEADPEPAAEAPVKKKRTRRKKVAASEAAAADVEPKPPAKKKTVRKKKVAAKAEEDPKPVVKPRRSLYGGARRRIGPGDLPTNRED